MQFYNILHPCVLNHMARYWFIQVVFYLYWFTSAPIGTWTDFRGSSHGQFWTPFGLLSIQDPKNPPDLSTLFCIMPFPGWNLVWYWVFQVAYHRCRFSGTWTAYRGSNQGQCWTLLGFFVNAGQSPPTTMLYSAQFLDLSFILCCTGCIPHLKIYRVVCRNFNCPDTPMDQGHFCPVEPLLAFCLFGALGKMCNIHTVFSILGLYRVYATFPDVQGHL